jgi:murein DD-endopeptidase MepM/ murein hydrolase activator NlpD
MAQPGDTLSALAKRFNTSVEEIRAANPFIPDEATTMPPGMPMKIPIYYLPFWGSPFKIIPDSQFVNSPSMIGFNTDEYIQKKPGWLKQYKGYISGKSVSSGQLIDSIARNYLVSPKLLLALLEYQTNALTNPYPSEKDRFYPLKYEDVQYKDVGMQLIWAANFLNDCFYRWREGELTQFELKDGRIERPDPWQNAATVALQNFFLFLNDQKQYEIDISPQGFAKTYRELFGDVWTNDQPHIPGSLQQPYFILPFEEGKIWALTGGPHTGWGTLQPWSALDFAPPSVAFGCIPSDEWVTAVADGLITRSETGLVSLDLDEDGDERTGWVVTYLHIATKDRIPLGTKVKAGDRIGHPSCEGGKSTGTHVHIMRQYNGEWVLAYGELAFNFEGWISFVPHSLPPSTHEKVLKLIRAHYLVFLKVVIANTNASSKTFISRSVTKQQTKK